MDFVNVPLIKYKLSNMWPEGSSFMEGIPADNFANLVYFALAMYILLLIFQTTSTCGWKMINLILSYLWTYLKVLWLWSRKSKVSKATHIYHASRMVYGESRLYLTTMVNGKEIRVKIPLELQANAGSRIRQATADQKEMAMPGSKMSPLKDSRGSQGGVVSFRDGEHNVIGMGCRIKYEGKTVLMTAYHVLEEIRGIENLYIEHKGNRLRFSLKHIRMRLQSVEMHRDVVLFEIDDSIWSVLGVAARKVIYSDVPCAIYAYGYNEDDDFSCSRGQLSPSHVAYQVEHTTSTLPGWSGTPLFNVQGCVVGMHCGWRPLPGLNYGIVAFWYNLARESGDRKSKHAWRYRDEDFSSEDEYEEFDVELMDDEGTAGIGKKASKHYKVKSGNGQLYALLHDDNPNSWANMRDDEYEKGPIFKEPNDSDIMPIVETPKQTILVAERPEVSSKVVSEDEIRKMIGDSLRIFTEEMLKKKVVEPIPKKKKPSLTPPPKAEPMVITKDSLKELVTECLKSVDFHKGSPITSVAPPKEKTKTVTGSAPSLNGGKQKRKRVRKSKSTQVLFVTAADTKSQSIPSQAKPLPATSIVLNNVEYTQRVPQSGSFPKGPSPMSVNPWRCTSHASALLFHLVQKLSPMQLQDYLRITRAPLHHSLCQGLRTGQSLMMNLCIVYSILFVTDESREMLIQAILGELLTNINREFIWNTENFSLMRVLSGFEPCARGIVEVISPLPRSWFIEA